MKSGQVGGARARTMPIIHRRASYSTETSCLRFTTNLRAAVRFRFQIWIAISVYVLVAIVKKRLNLPRSLYETLQILATQHRQFGRPTYESRFRLDLPGL